MRSRHRSLGVLLSACVQLRLLDAQFARVDL
jgi:hypothetical protein